MKKFSKAKVNYKKPERKIMNKQTRRVIKAKLNLCCNCGFIIEECVCANEQPD